jgi:hypothetical protein
MWDNDAEKPRQPSGPPGWLCVVVLIVGVAVATAGLEEMQVSDIAKMTPQALSAESLIADGYGDNAHVIVTGCVPIDDYVFESQGGLESSPWDAVWVPCASEEDEDLEGPFFCLKFTDVRNVDQLDIALDTATFQGVVINEIVNDVSRNDRTERQLLDSMFPRANFAQVVRLEVGRTPGDHGPAVLGVGALIAIAALGFGIRAIIVRRQFNEAHLAYLAAYGRDEPRAPRRARGPAPSLRPRPRAAPATNANPNDLDDDEFEVIDDGHPPRR